MRALLILLLAGPVLAKPGHRLVIQEGHRGGVSAVAFSPDGARVATGGYDGTTKIWSVATGRLEVGFPPLGRVTGLAFSPDGRRLLAGHVNARAILWDLPTGTREKTLDLDRGGYCGVAFSPDGRWLAFGGDRLCRAIALAGTGTQLTFEGPQRDRFWALAFDPSSTHLAVASDEECVYLWRLADGRLVRRLEGFPADVIDIRFTGADELVTVVRNGPVQRWNWRTGEARGRVADKAAAFAAGPDGKTAVALPGGGVVLGARRLDANADALAFRADGAILAVGDQLWDVATGQRVRTLGGAKASPVAVGTGGLVAALDGERLVVFDLPAGRVVWTAPKPAGPRARAAFSPDGKWLAYRPRGAPVARVDLAAGTETRIEAPGAGPVAAGPDGVVAWREAADAIAVWRDGGREGTLPGNKYTDILGLGFSADGATLAQGGKGNFVRLLAVADGSERGELRPGSGWVVSFAFDRAGKRLLCGGPYAAITLRATKDLAALRTLHGHSGSVRSVAFAANETRILSAGAEDTVRIWETATGAHRATLHLLPKGEWLLLAADGPYDASPGAGAHCSWRAGERSLPLESLAPTRGLARRLLTAP